MSENNSNGKKNFFKRLSGFKKFLVIYASALVVIIAVALVLLYGLLKDYEAGRPANTMDKLVSHIEAGNVGKWIKDAGILGEFETEDIVSDYFKDTFADKEKTVYLRYTVKRTGTKDTKEMALAVKNVPVEEVTLEISFDGKAYEKQVSFTAKAGRWVGVKNGMFVNHNNEIKNENQGDGFVTVDYIRYRCIDNGRLD